MPDVRVASDCSVKVLLDAIVAAADLGDGDLISLLLDGVVLDAHDTLAGQEFEDSVVVDVVRKNPDEWVPGWYCELPAPDASELSRDARAFPAMVMNCMVDQYCGRGLGYQKVNLFSNQSFHSDPQNAEEWRQRCCDRVEPGMSYSRRRFTIAFAESEAARRDLSDFSYACHPDGTWSWRYCGKFNDITDTLPRRTVGFAEEAARSREARLQAMVGGQAEFCAGSRPKQEGERPSVPYDAKRDPYCNALRPPNVWR